VSLGNLFQRIALICDRFYLPRLNQLREEDKIFDLLTCWPQTRSRKLYLFAAAFCRSKHLKHNYRCRDRRKINTFIRQRTFVL
jgi:hypothetical protein